MPQLTQGTKFLLIVNIAMFALTLIAQKLDIVDLDQYLALFYIKSEYFRPHQYFTYMFMHGGILHLFFNMYALFLFGSILEQVWGIKRFMFYYIATGIGAAIVNTIVCYFQFTPIQELLQTFIASPNPNTLEAIAQKSNNLNLTVVYEIIDQWNTLSTNDIQEITKQISTAVSHTIASPMIGASGAVFGLLLAFAITFPDLKLHIIFIPIGIPAKYFVLIYGLIELFFGINNFSGDNIAHWAHLGGLLAGIIIILIWHKYPGNRFFNT